MREAIAEARRALYSTAPNPRVGCVVVRDGVVVGRGFHARAGEPHAEVFALREAGDAASGATAYVTLEPCSHHGRTPPCADALIAADIARVVYAVGDPDPRVDGRGAAKLRAAGIAVLQGVLEEEARELNRGFLRRVGGGLPWVRAKVGASLDGRTALADGRSKWITSAEARADVQRLRAEAGVVLTGIGTVLADDPALIVRDSALLEAMRGRQVARAVLDPAGRLPPNAQLRDGAAPTWWLVAEEVASKLAPTEAPSNPEEVASKLAPTGALSNVGGSLLPTLQSAASCLPQLLPTPGAGRPSPRAVLELLAAHGVNDVLLEAGATLTGAWLAAGVIDELVVYYAPRLLGDAARPLALLSTNTPDPLAATPAWCLHEATAVGTDLRVTWRRVAT
jgi:diaminohydroxyphosphoribosylaminopyrimidine deaminase/5-amino-6-(5-phosphoribosylamino)uracil reductase